MMSPSPNPPGNSLVNPPANPLANTVPANNLADLVVSSSNPSNDFPSDPQETGILSFRKKKVALYVWHHGGRAAAKHFKIHHKNVQRWLKNEQNEIKYPQ